MSAEVIKMSSQDKDKNVALEAAIGQIEKAFGKGSVMKLGTSGANMDVQAISSGSLGLDVALGIGGLPKGRIVEIYVYHLRKRSQQGLYSFCPCLVCTYE